MNERQYQQFCENRRVRAALRLDEPAPRRPSSGRHDAKRPKTPVAAVIATAARQLQRRQMAVAAWQQVARPEWLVQTMVDCVQAGTLVIAAGSSTVCYDLRRQSAALERALAKLLPGVSHVRFVVRGRDTEALEEGKPRGGLGPRAGGPSD